MKKYFTMDIKDILEELGSSRNGLNSSQIEELLKKYGKNELIEEKRPNILMVFLSQFKDFIVMVLIVAAVIAYFSGNSESSVVIFIVLILNSILGTVQHKKAEKSLDNLKKLSAPKARVIRDGTQIEVDSNSLVPGDLIFLEAGDIVPADSRIIENHSLMVDETSLTGESVAVEKIHKVIEKENLALAEQKNMVFMGTVVNYGRAIAVVTNTGMNTEMGKVAELMNKTVDGRTPLQISLDEFGKKLTFFVLILCMFIMGVYIFNGNSILDSLILAVALAVAAVPEALTPIITMILSIETQNLSKQNTIIKDLKSIETLGSVSVICSDKTGTLTQNKMLVKHFYMNSKEDNKLENSSETDKLLLESLVLCSDATDILGDPTEIALVQVYKNMGLDFEKLRSENKRLSEVPFDSDRKLMSTLYEIDNKFIMFTKGALGSFAPRLTKISENGIVRDITREDLEAIRDRNIKFAAEGLRILTFAYKELKEKKHLGLEDEYDYTFLALVSMYDPPREESYQAIKDCRAAGIKPVMITGDQKATARAIAEKIGIYKEGDEVLEGIEVSKLSEKELIEKVENISVYARVSPEDKIRIVNAWQSKGKICAMTGDGVNDAPALKKADIGIAMGITGTEVSKGAASMILTDDNFATIIKAVGIGRGVYMNIKNAIAYLLSGNSAAILAVLYTALANLPIIFSPVQLLFINLVTDSLPAISVGIEPSTEDMLSEKPRDPKEPILTNRFMGKLLFEGSLIAISVLVAFYIGINNGGGIKGSTMAFSTLCLIRLLHLLNYRGKRHIFSVGIFKNKFSIVAFLTGLVLLYAVLKTKSLYSVFMIEALTNKELMIVGLVSLIPIIIIQIIKYIRYR